MTTGELEWQWNNYQIVSDGGAAISFDFTNPKDIGVIVTNTYPGWYADVWLEEANIGTLPLHFVSFAVSADNSGWGPYYSLSFFAPDDSINLGPYTMQAIEDMGTVTYSGVGITSGISIPVGGTHWSKIRISLNANAPQSYLSTFTFTFTHTAAPGLE